MGSRESGGEIDVSPHGARICYDDDCDCGETHFLGSTNTAVTRPDERPYIVETPAPPVSRNTGISP